MKNASKELDRGKVTRSIVQAGVKIDLGDGAVLTVLNPATTPDPAADTRADANDQSVVLRLTWEQASVLLTGDIAAEAESSLIWSEQPLVGRRAQAGPPRQQQLVERRLCGSRAPHLCCCLSRCRQPVWPSGDGRPGSSDPTGSHRPSHRPGRYYRADYGRPAVVGQDRAVTAF